MTCQIYMNYLLKDITKNMNPKVQTGEMRGLCMVVYGTLCGLGKGQENEEM